MNLRRIPPLLVGATAAWLWLFAANAAEPPLPPQEAHHPPSSPGAGSSVGSFGTQPQAAEGANRFAQLDPRILEDRKQPTSVEKTEKKVPRTLEPSATKPATKSGSASSKKVPEPGNQKPATQGAVPTTQKPLGQTTLGGASRLPADGRQAMPRTGPQGSLVPDLIPDDPWDKIMLKMIQDMKKEIAGLEAEVAMLKKHSHEYSHWMAGSSGFQWVTIRQLRKMEDDEGESIDNWGVRFMPAPDGSSDGKVMTSEPR